MSMTHVYNHVCAWKRETSSQRRKFIALVCQILPMDDSYYSSWSLLHVKYVETSYDFNIPYPKIEVLEILCMLQPLVYERRLHATWFTLSITSKYENCGGWSIWMIHRTCGWCRKFSIPAHSSLPYSIMYICTFISYLCVCVGKHAQTQTYTHIVASLLDCKCVSTPMHQVGPNLAHLFKCATLWPFYEWIKHVERWFFNFLFLHLDSLWC